MLISPPTAQLVPRVQPVDVVPFSPVVHPHLMRTRGAISFQEPKLYGAPALSPIPKLVRAALTDPYWRVAMEKEYAALMSNDTWDLVPHPRSANIVTIKWIFKHKFMAYRTLERYNARCVLCWFTQSSDINYDVTFNPIVKPTTVHTILSLALY
jgi:hypothetical protein